MLSMLYMGIRLDLWYAAVQLLLYVQGSDANNFYI